MLEARSMRSNLAIILLLSCIISISTVLAFSQEPKSKKVLLIFSADWCKYCQIAKNDMKNDQQLSEIIKNYTIVDVDFDVDKDIVKGYNVKTIPAFVVFENDKEKGRKIGYNGPSNLVNFLKPPLLCGSLK